MRNTFLKTKMITHRLAALSGLLIAAVHAPAAVPENPEEAAQEMRDAQPQAGYSEQIYHYKRGHMEMKLWVPYPPGGEVVRGIFQRGNAGRGNFLCWIEDEQFRAYASEHGFGMASTRGIWGAHAYEIYGEYVLEAYRMWTEMGLHPELANVPFVCFGNSSSGAFSYGFASLVPERVICFAVNVPAGLQPTDPVPGLLEVPGIFIAGEVDTLVGNLAVHTEPLMRKARPLGALWSKIEVEGMGHEHRRTLHIFYPLFEKAIALRYPAEADPRSGPVHLKPIEASSGWLADDTSWGTGWTQIAAYADFAGDTRGPDTSWLLDKEMAFLHRAYSSRSSRVNIRSEDELPWPAFCNNSETIQRAPGSKIFLAVEMTDLPDWESITLYDGAEPLETLPGSGSRTWFEVVIPEDATSRYRAFHVIAEKDGISYPSHMYTPLILKARRN